MLMKKEGRQKPVSSPKTKKRSIDSAKFTKFRGFRPKLLYGRLEKRGPVDEFLIYHYTIDFLTTIE